GSVIDTDAARPLGEPRGGPGDRHSLQQWHDVVRSRTGTPQLDCRPETATLEYGAGRRLARWPRYCGTGRQRRPPDHELHRPDRDEPVRPPDEHAAGSERTAYRL